MTDRLLALLAEIHPEHDFRESSDFIHDGLLDSFDIVTLVVALEEAFSISIDGEDVTWENFRNLESLENFLDRCLEAESPNREKTLSTEEGP
ncbi:MAG: acyl carrier protein [Deltaproteobacteria bacterium]|nr:acyl carrier protein [Deltaproteobacteria bacterium]